MEGPDGGNQLKAPVKVHAVGAQSVWARSFMSTTKDTRGSLGVSTEVPGGNWSDLEAPDFAWCKQWCQYQCVGGYWIYRTEDPQPAGGAGT